MHISFCGAAGEVTGSGYLVQTAKARVLVDFGMFQGRGRPTPATGISGRSSHWPWTRSWSRMRHLDHTGRLPLLPSRGYRGPIHATPATVDFTRSSSKTRHRLQEADAEKHSRRLLRAGRKPIKPIYGPADVEALAPLFVPLPYGQPKEVADGITVRLVDAGHILGSASIEMTVSEGGPPARGRLFRRCRPEGLAHRPRPDAARPRRPGLSRVDLRRPRPPLAGRDPEGVP